MPLNTKTDSASHMLKSNCAEDSQIVWDIKTDDFHSDGDFAFLRNNLTTSGFQSLIAEELERIEHFLIEWERQLKQFDCERFQKVSNSLKKLFLQTPSLSGVVYLSNNIVISEEFFDAEQEGIDHVTDRRVNHKILKNLPWTADLTFSFPRKYCFFGFYNSWGFIRFPRKDDNGRDAGVLVSATTLDPRIMTVCEHAGFRHIADMYNRVWDDTIHDYIHHIGLYTNPSFGIGRHSPMSIAKANELVDAWGAAMESTFNYEYWAHRTHRLITDKTLSTNQCERITAAACDYVDEVYRLYDYLIQSSENQTEAENIIGYLLAIYLWPLSILLHPESNWLKTISKRINSGIFSQKKIPISRISELLLEQGYAECDELRTQLQSIDIEEKIQGIHNFANKASSGIEIGTAGTLKSLGLDLWDVDTHLSWYGWIRAYTDIIAKRGLYQNWYHDLPVAFENNTVHPHYATLRFLEILPDTFSQFNSSGLSSYQLRGIVA